MSSVNETCTEQSRSIPNGWIETNLGKLGRVITGKTPSKNNPNDWGDNFDFITPSEIDNSSKYIFNTPRKLSQQGFDRFSRMILPTNSVIVTCIGSDMGKVVMNKNQALTNQQINSIAISDEYNNDYVFYLLKNAYRVLRRNAEGSGSTMPILNKSSFESLTFVVPEDIKEQKSIANILTAFDDKIENLQAQNKTLEKTAQTIFNEWFGKYQVGDELPDGWRVGNLGEVTKLVGGTTPSTKNEDFWNGNIYWSSPKDLSNNEYIYLLSTEKKITEKGLKKISSGLLPKNTLLLSSRAPVGYLALTNIELAINQGYIAILPSQYFSNYYTLLWLKKNMKKVISAANGSTFLEISKSAFRTIDCVIPKKSKIEDFDKTVAPFFIKTLSNQKQIQTLKKTRDILLPKLMSGQLRVNV